MREGIGTTVCALFSSNSQRMDDGDARNDLFEGFAAYADALALGDGDDDVDGDDMANAILGHPVRVIPRDPSTDDGLETHTSREQHRVEQVVGPMVREAMDFPSSRRRFVHGGGGCFPPTPHNAGWNCAATST